MAACRMRWMEALEILPEGPERELLRAAGHALTSTEQMAMVRLGSAVDAVVDKIIAEHPIEIMEESVSPALISR